MKLAIVTPYPPSKTTLNEYGYYLVKHFNENKNIDEIVILTDKLPNGESYALESELTKVKIETAWSFNSFKNVFSIRKVLKAHKPDVAMYNLQFLSFGDNKVAATLGLLSPMISKINGVPSTVLLHNITETVDLAEAGITQSKIMSRLYNMVGTVLTKIILQANIVAFTIPKYVDIIQKKYKVDNIVHMPHGTFELPAKPSFQNDPIAKKQIMTFGKFGTYKKVEKMIEAIDIVRKRIKEPIEIVIAGTDNPNVKGYLKNVEEKYRHIPDMVFTGYVAEEDVEKTFRNCTATVFPYTSTTGSSGVLHQAGSYGKAAVLPLLGDLKELVEEEGYTGSFFEPDNVESMANAIEKILTDDEYRVGIEKQNYNAASALSMTEIVKRYVHVFKSTTDQYHPRRRDEKKQRQLQPA